jgi:hypothetical protein
MQIEVDVFRSTDCESYDQAIGRAYAFSKENLGITFYVIKGLTKYRVGDRNDAGEGEKVVCEYKNGIKTVKA